MRKGFSTGRTRGLGGFLGSKSPLLSMVQLPDSHGPITVHLQFRETAATRTCHPNVGSVKNQAFRGDSYGEGPEDCPVAGAQLGHAGASRTAGASRISHPDAGSVKGHIERKSTGA